MNGKHLSYDTNVSDDKFKNSKKTETKLNEEQNFRFNKEKSKRRNIPRSSKFPCEILEGKKQYDMAVYFDQDERD